MNIVYVGSEDEAEYALIDFTNEEEWDEVWYFNSDDRLHVDVDTQYQVEEIFSMTKITWQEFKDKYKIEMSDVLDAISKHSGRY